MPDADDAEVTTEVTDSDDAAAEAAVTEVTPVDDGDGDTLLYRRSDIEKIRRESHGYRDRAKTAEARADELSRALFAARVAATGKLADATDLEYDPDILDDPDALTAAIESLIERKPHLRARSIAGDAGLGRRGENSPTPSLMEILRSKV